MPSSGKAKDVKPAAKPTAKAASAKPAPAKKPAAPAKKPLKAPEKPVAKAKPAPAAKAVPAKPAPKTTGAAKPAAKTAPSKAETAPAKAPAKTAPKATPAAAKQTAPADARKSAPKKKLNVGQKPRSERTEFNVKPAAPAPAAREAAAAAPKPSPASKEAKSTFKLHDSVVYPAHGVGRIVGVEKQVIAGITNELFVIDFEQEKMRLRVPTAKAMAVGMRALSDDAQIKKAVDLLKGRARIKRTMWSRRAQEYEAKINSGDVLAVAEVVRDLYRATDQPEQSYSERQLFEQALDRLAREVAAVRKVDLAQALTELDASLQQKKAA